MKISSKGIIVLFFSLFFVSAAYSQVPSEISGTVSLPDGAASSETRLFVSLEVYGDASFDNFLDSSFENVIIEVGEDSGNFTIEIPQLTIATHFTIRVGCNSTSCSDEFVSSYQYTSNGFIAGGLFEFIQVDSFPVSFDVTLDRGSDLSGVVTLPTGVADGAIPAFVSVDVFNSAGMQVGFFDANVVSRPVILDGESETDFNLRVSSLPSGGFYRLRYQCDNTNSDANCGDLITSVFYYTPNGPSASFSDPNTQLFSLPISPVTLPLMEGQRVSGTVSLPAGFTVDRDVQAGVFLETLDEFSNSVAFASVDVTIAQGSDSATFEIVINPVNSGSYRFSYRCAEFSNTCDGLFTGDTFSNGVATSFFFGGSDIPFNQLPSQFDVVLLEGAEVSGSLLLPSGTSASQTGFTAVQITVFDANGENIGEFSDFPTINVGQNSSEYNLSFPLVGNAYSLQFRCDFGCPGGTITPLFYTPAGVSQDANSSLLIASEIPTELDLQFIARPVRVVGGDISLPQIRTVDTNFFVNAQVFDSQLRFIGSESFAGTIQAGSNSSSYELAVPEVPDGFLIINFGCNFGADCGALLSEIYYTPSGNFFTFDFDSIANELSAVSSPTNLTISEGELVTGTISLPVGSLPADEPINTFISVVGWNSESEFLFSSSQNFTIELGQTETPFEIFVPPAPASLSTVTINYGCSFNECDDLLSSTFYRPDRTVFFASDALIDPELLNSELELILVEGLRIEGSIELENNIQAVGSLPIIVSARTPIDQSGNSDFVGTASLSILNGQSSAGFSILLPPDPELEVVLSAFCDRFINGPEDCEGFVVTSFLDGDSTVFTEENISIPIADISDPFSLTLVQGNLVSVSGFVPIELNIDLPTLINIIVESFDSNGISLEVQNFSAFAERGGSFPSSLALFDPGPGGRYEFVYECFPGGRFTHDCSGLEISDPSYRVTQLVDELTPATLMIQIQIQILIQIQIQIQIQIAIQYYHQSICCFWTKRSKPRSDRVC